jgi:HK97 family phage prohead protease
MPYGISNNQEGCAGWAAVKKESDGSYTTLKCYVSKQDAIDRMLAQSIAEKLDPLGEVGRRNLFENRADGYKPTAGMKSEAEKGLEWRKEFNRGGTAIGVARARDIINDSNFPIETVKRMYSYFARHEVDKKGQGFYPSDDGFPSAGRIAWALWGGDAGQSWSRKIVKQLETNKRNRQAGQFVICDIDDTLLTSGVRPMQKNINALNFMADKYEIVLVTGRLEAQRQATVKALTDAGVKYDRLVMKQDSKQDTTEYKSDAAKRLQIAKKVNVAIDNDQKARTAYSDLGIHAIGPNDLKEPRTNPNVCKVEAVMTDQRDVYGNTNDVAPEGMLAGALSDVLPMADQQQEPVEEIVTPEMLVEELRSLVASTVSMYFQAHGSHWNVRGQDFAQYHSLFQEIYEDVYSAIDPTAEMVRKLDGEAPFELQELVSLRKVDEALVQDNPSSLASALLSSNDQMIEALNCTYEYADELDEQGICNFIAERIDMHRKWGWQLKASLDMTQQRSTSGWAVRSDDGKRSYAYTNLEVRATDDGKTLVGYAAMWDTPSHPMPFTEFVKRGAFTKTLNDGADVRLLIDHEGVPLARTKSGTLKLSEDERGLLVEAQLDPLNPDAARVMSAMKRGDLSQMSFAFRTIKDAWSKDRKTRELREVQLFDVSIVTFPAYEQTVAELRKEITPVTVSATSGVRLRKSQIELQKYRSR